MKKPEIKKPGTPPEVPKYMFREQPNGDVFPSRVVPGNSVLELRSQVYQIAITEEGQLFLQPTETGESPKKIYGDVGANTDRYFRTFERLETNLGINLVGQKGSGKTTTIRVMIKTALMLGYPVIFVNFRLGGPPLYEMMRSITQPVMVVFDEFDKNYYDETDKLGVSVQNTLLPVFDGSVGGGKKLFVIAANDRSKISEFLVNRPSRIRYTQMFNMLPFEVALGYINDNLKDKSMFNMLDFLRLRSYCNTLNFDMLATIVDEMNHNKGTGVIETFNIMFGPNDLSGQIHYIATLKKGDEVLETFAVERRNNHMTPFIQLHIDNSTEDEVTWAEVKNLNAADIISCSDDLMTHRYQKGGIEVELVVIAEGLLEETIADTSFRPLPTETQLRIMQLSEKQREFSIKRSTRLMEVAAAKAVFEQKAGIDDKQGDQLNNLAAETVRQVLGGEVSSKDFSPTLLDLPIHHLKDGAFPGHPNYDPNGVGGDGVLINKNRLSRATGNLISGSGPEAKGTGG